MENAIHFDGEFRKGNNLSWACCVTFMLAQAPYLKFWASSRSCILAMSLSQKNEHFIVTAAFAGVRMVDSFALGTMK